MKTVFLVLAGVFAATGLTMAVLGLLYDSSALPGLLFGTFFGLLWLLPYFLCRTREQERACEQAYVKPWQQVAEAECLHGTCPTCGREGVGWNVVTTRGLVGAIVVTYRRTMAVAGCVRCVRRAAWPGLVGTLFLGWWSISGLIQTPIVLVQQTLLVVRGGGRRPTREMLWRVTQARRRQPAADTRCKSARFQN